eukprot:Colp12_sorted_trinity150504_noHs@13745
MKFGNTLRKCLMSDWRFYYLDYAALKNFLKTHSPNYKDKTQSKTQSVYTEDDEAQFVALMENEFIKVSEFSFVKKGELIRRVEYYEREIKSAVQNGGSENEAYVKQLTEEMETLTADIVKLAKFNNLNYTGFMKILKKHDKYTPFCLKPTFMARLNTKPFYKENFDALIARLSALYELIREGKEVSPVPRPSGTQTTTVKTSRKYWIHKDNITDVKCVILKHLPVMTFRRKDGQEQEPQISSVYLDNDKLELFHARAENQKGAISIRIRWYGKDSDEVYIEKKVHDVEAGWSLETSAKSRFPLKEKYVADYLSGKWTYDKKLESMRETGQHTEAELQELLALANEIQEIIVSRQLKPMIRTFYNRISFALPGSSDVRINLDTEITMIREDERLGNGWRRVDVGINHPFSHIASQDIVRFPHGCLEVKLETRQTEEAPEWVRRLVGGPLVEEVPTFSKFIHGVATLLESRVSVLPNWLPQLEKDIRKNTASQKLDAYQTSTTTYEFQEPAPSSINSRPKDHVTVNLKGVADEDGEEEDENTPLLGKGKDKGKKPEARQRKTVSTAPSGRTPDPIAIAKTPGKKIQIPVKIEPKVFFANERTFLSWLHTSVYISTIGVALLNFGDKAARVGGLVLVGVAMLFILYAMATYFWRAHRIRTRHPGPYDDRHGPTVLVVFLLFGLLINVILRAIH